jgi:ELWxxDGT repeat protein
MSLLHKRGLMMRSWILIVVSVSVRGAAEPHLVRDINTTPSSSWPGDLVVLGGKIYFSATDVPHGRELWVTDGTVEGTTLLKEIHPGREGSNPAGLTVVGNQLFFAADDGSVGRELWSTDGTPEGTTLVKDINPGRGASSPEWITADGGRAFFSADDGINGRELWSSDGTPEGTALILDINGGFEGSGPWGLASASAQITFMANDGVHGQEPWSTDGTAAGTSIVVDVKPGPLGSDPGSSAALGNQVYFTADNGRDGQELWVTDGTSGGTRLFKDVKPGPGGSDCHIVGTIGPWLYFAADDGVHGRKIWVTDGTPEATQRYEVVAPGTIPLPIWEDKACLGERCFGSGYDQQTGHELWIYLLQGEGEAQLLKDIHVGTEGSWPSAWHEEVFALLGDRVLLCLRDPAGTGSKQLWIGDGTEDGTMPLTDVSCCGQGAVFGDRYYFEADAELWSTDGTPAGTELVKDIDPDLCLHPGLGAFRVLGSRLFLAADDHVHGSELWTTDGAPEGTQLVIDLQPGPLGSHPRAFSVIADRLVFVAVVGGSSQVWLSDGTGAGTTPRTDPDSGPNLESTVELTPMGGSLLFSASDDIHGQELWTLDVAVGSASLLKDIVPGPGGSYPTAFTRVGNRTYFSVSTGPLGDGELWVTVGTPDGTVLVKRLAQGRSAPLELTAMGNRLYFVAPEGSVAADADLAWQLWSSDGTSEGTEAIWHLGRFPCCEGGAYRPRVLNRAGTLFFTANDPLYGGELFAWNIEHVAFHRADPNHDARTDLSDALSIFGYLFLGDAAPSCRESADVNNDGAIDISDGIGVLNWLFLGGEAPAPPGPAGGPCGEDPDAAGSPGDLGCGAYRHCEG